MTTPYKIPPDLFKGETVAVLASGPSMTQEIADSLRQHKRIVVNYMYRLAPDAEMLVAMDSLIACSEETKDFKGLKICGWEDPDLDGLYVGARWQRIKLRENHEIEIRNSGLAACEIAGETGATKIILAGFDPEIHGHRSGEPEGNDDGQSIAGEPYPGLTKGLEQMIVKLQAKGIVVERIRPPAEAKSRVALFVPQR